MISRIVLKNCFPAYCKVLSPADKDFCLKLLSLMKDKIVSEYNNEYKQAWESAYNKYLMEFILHFCTDNGTINWEKLLEFNSGMGE